jgi:hypothetical protein
MNKTRLFAAAAILSALVASPVLARDASHHRSMSHQQYDNSYNRNNGFWPGELAAGVVGGAIGTAGAIASAPFRGAYAYDNGYNGYEGDYRYSQSYAQKNGFVCMPGTWFRGEDGRQHLCQ